MLFRKSSDVLRDIRKAQSKVERKVKRTFLADGLGQDVLANEVLCFKNPKLVAEYLDLQAREREAIKCYGKGIKSDKVIERIYKTLRNNGMCPPDYMQLLNLLEDIDPCIAVVCRVVSDKDTHVSITPEMWRDALLCALAFKVHNAPMGLNSYFPFGEQEWKNFYILACTHLLRTPTVEVTKVVKERQAPKTVVLPVDQRLQARYEVLQDTLRGSEEAHRKQQQALAASYNKTVKDQRAEILRLRSMLPPDVVAELGEEVIPETELLPLPTAGVTFVGATDATVRRLQTLYPDWDYIGVDEYPEAYPDNPLCFVHTKCISHGQYMHVKQYCSSTILHCHTTNVERIVTDMRNYYTHYMRGHLAADEEEG